MPVTTPFLGEILCDEQECNPDDGFVAYIAKGDVSAQGDIKFSAFLPMCSFVIRVVIAFGCVCLSAMVSLKKCLCT